MKYLKKFESYNMSDVDDILSQIDDFINSNQRSLWISNDAIKIYIRKSKRYYKGQILDFFDFATIEATETGQGLFTKILNEFEKTYPDKNIFIESVITDRFKDTIKNKWGFEEFNDDSNFYKVK